MRNRRDRDMGIAVQQRSRSVIRDGEGRLTDTVTDEKVPDRHRDVETALHDLRGLLEDP